MEKIGFLGLGKMGFPMSKRLLENGSYELHVYNRTSGIASSLGAMVASSPAELSSEVNRLVIMVSDDRACEEVLFGQNGVAESTGRPLVINMSTISPNASSEFESRLRQKGFEYIEAPVLGSVGPAEQGNLVILAAGKHRDRATDLFDIFGRVTYSYPEVGIAAKVKLLVNTNLGVQMAVLSETLGAAEKLGIPVSDFLDVVNDSAVKTIVSQFKAKNLLSGEYPSAFPYKDLLKDLNYSIAMSSEVGAKNDITRVVRDIYAEGNDLMDQDFSAVRKLY